MRTFTLLLSALFGFLAVACNSTPVQMTNSPDSSGSGKSDSTSALQTDTATFGGGCFWCIEAIFQQMRGVKSVASGYSGGARPDPSYEQVCSGATGHAEVVQVVFNPAEVSYDELLEVFWSVHDPTTLNRQGADVGTQYRSVIFYHSEEQRRLAEGYKEKLNASGTWSDPVVTEISPIRGFYIAEKYHQNYYNDNGGQPYCTMVIRPKVEKFRKVFADKLKR